MWTFHLISASLMLADLILITLVSLATCIHVHVMIIRYYNTLQCRDYGFDEFYNLVCIIASDNQLPLGESCSHYRPSNHTLSYSVTLPLSWPSLPFSF